MDTNPCECEGPGFCQRYKKKQSERHFQICKGEVLTPEKCEVYRKNWAKLAEVGVEGLMLEKARKVGNAAKEWIEAGRPVRPAEERNALIAICSACPMLMKLAGFYRCGSCGCMIFAKATMATETCPKGYWPEKTEPPADASGTDQS